MAIPTYAKIEDSEIDNGSPVTPELFQKLRNNLLAGFKGDNSTANLTAETDTTKVLKPDGSGGVQWSALTVPTITDWEIVLSGITISSTGISPTKGATRDEGLTWRRVGHTLNARYYYDQTVGGTGGSGDYLFDLPNGLEVDTSKHTIYTGTSTYNGYPKAIIGMGYMRGVDGYTIHGNSYAVLYNSTKFRIFIQANTGGGPGYYAWMSSAAYQLNLANIGFFLDISVPIAGWTS